MIERTRYPLGKTAKRILELREHGPSISNTKIADVTGVTKAWVGFVLNREGLLPARRPKLVRYCPVCGHEARARSRFCGDECSAINNQHRRDSHRIWLQCDMCGRRFQRLLSEYKKSLKANSKYTFCDNRCQGRWLGLTYGNGGAARTVEASRRKAQ